MTKPQNSPDFTGSPLSLINAMLSALLNLIFRHKSLHIDLDWYNTFPFSFSAQLWSLFTSRRWWFHWSRTHLHLYSYSHVCQLTRVLNHRTYSHPHLPMTQPPLLSPNSKPKLHSHSSVLIFVLLFHFWIFNGHARTIHCCYDVQGDESMYLRGHTQNPSKWFTSWHPSLCSWCTRTELYLRARCALISWNMQKG